MNTQMPGYQEQKQTFDIMQRSIDMDLREAGFEDVLRRHSVDASLGRLVVGRDFIYNTEAGDMGMDPFAVRIGVYHEVGLYKTTGNSHSWNMMRVSLSLLDGPHEPTELGLELSKDQLNVVHDSLQSLFRARQEFRIRYVDKDLRHFD